MKIERVSTDLLRLSLGPLDAVNVYVLRDILVDSGVKFARRRLLSALAGMAIKGHVITHAHTHTSTIRAAVTLYAGISGSRSCVGREIGQQPRPAI